MVELYARQWRFKVNHGKSNVLVFGSSSVRQAASQRVWSLAGTSIKYTEVYKYLGVEFVTAMAAIEESGMQCSPGSRQKLGLLCLSSCISAAAMLVSPENICPSVENTSAPATGVRL